MKTKIFLYSFLLGAVVSLSSNCSKNKSGGGDSTPAVPVEAWVTRANRTLELAKQTPNLTFAAVTNNFTNIEVDSVTKFQTVDGFGYTLTGGSAYLINKMDAASKAALLNEVFGSGNDGIAVSYLRVSIGASDLSNEVFSYNDMPAGQTDPTLANFSLSKDTVDLIPVLKQILTINPNIKILGSPWSAPVWMKDNGSSVGGSLQTQYYGAYAQYFVKYIQAMKSKGITIDAVTVQNEPQHGGNNPSMVMSAAQQADFIKNHLGPVFRTAGLSTKIIIWDHNCDNPNYPITILNDPLAKQYIDGSAFHLYAGDIGALSGVQAAHPDKNLYFTEQWTGANGSFDGDLKWHIKNVIIGSMRNWSKVALEWNLASDPAYDPHTPGGCSECKGAVTINASVVTRNVAYYIIAHASKFVPAGSVRIASNYVNSLPNVAFLRPDGKKVLLVLNDGGGTASFNIKFKGKSVVAELPAGAVGTYVW